MEIKIKNKENNYFDIAFQSIGCVLEKIINNPNETKILLCLFRKPMIHKEIAEMTKIKNPSKYLKKLMKQNYIDRTWLAPGHPQYYNTPLGDAIALGFISLIKTLGNSGKLEELIPDTKEHVEIAKEVIKRLLSQEKSKITVTNMSRIPSER
jgi:DNA-binding transcriptional regulator GbsR (MarR family)